MMQYDPHHDRGADHQRPRADHPDPPLRPQVRRRNDDARGNDAGRVGVHHRAALRSIGWSKTTLAWPIGPRRRADSPRCWCRWIAWMRAERRRPDRPNRSQAGRGGSAPVARPLGDVGRRQRRCERSRYRDCSGREGAGRRRIRHGQEHAGTGDRRPVAVGYGRDPDQRRRAAS